MSSPAWAGIAVEIAETAKIAITGMIRTATPPRAIRIAAGYSTGRRIFLALSYPTDFATQMPYHGTIRSWFPPLLCPSV
jgi:hypothetical protein